MEERLLDAATRVLERDGLPGITTKRIAQEAGCSEGSIYNHFGSKEDLLAEVVKARMSAFPARAAEFPDSPGTDDVRERLREIAELALAFYRRGTGHLVAMINNPDAMQQHVREVHARGGGPWRTVDDLSRWLRAEQDLGLVDPGANPVAAVTALLGAMLFHAITSATWGAEFGAPDDEVAVDRAVAAVWHGLAPAG
ncbi:TetR/AcrR family transcriptional regulator [Egicoccus sp. AB-alg2]|uniref:TetR/AcrR family transcriptional regulator n=1 Tax=Egicoccus sp. AB-alg2 TaxID=3242693 RepID=UPI00359E8AD4